MSPRRNLLAIAALALTCATTGRSQEKGPADVPRARDSRLEVVRFASAPEIVHPINMDFDSRGRLLVIESHTHFRPEGYKGPKHDRVRVIEDTDGDGKADRFGTFFEGTTFTMDIAVHPSGSIYLATRNEILRLQDKDGDGKSDESQRLVFLDTTGNYPHNGISGLAFDSNGDLLFGMGENLGADYTLRGADGITLRGGGEGGGVFRASALGKGLHRIATGFWNPFGLARDIFGRFFAVDNDPDSMPPCRLLHVVEGGDYGYQFRYGRSGRHPFQAWNGELPGTLPMMSGTGEAPCEVVSYESDGLPLDYLGNLLVTSWADHRIERYVPKPRGASFTAEMQPFVQGGKDFRPVGLVVAPDGSLFLSDWVLKDYNLHGKGALWQVRAKTATRRERPDDPKLALLSAHRPIRDAAARRLASDEPGREILRRQVSSDDTRVRAACLTALIDAGDDKIDLKAVAQNDPEIAIRAMAVRALAARGDDTTPYLDARQPAEVRMAAMGSKTDVPHLLALLDDPDPFLRSAAVLQLSRSPERLATIDGHALKLARQRIGLLLAERASGRSEAARLVPGFLADPDEDVRFLAAKWVADDKLKEFRPLLVEALNDHGLNVRMVAAFSTALARVDNQDVGEAKMADYFLDRLGDDRNPPALRVKALQLVPATNPKLTLNLLTKLIEQADPSLRLEAVRAISEQTNPGRMKVLLDVARDSRWEIAVRAQAILGLSEQSQDVRDALIAFARGDEPTLRDESLRALVNMPLTTSQREKLETLAPRDPQTEALVARVLGRPFVKDRPAPENIDEWRARLDGPADVEAGRRVFFHPRLAGCFRCHRVDGRGREIGPDLSAIGRTERRRIVESIVQPSNAIGPSYQNWQIATTDGKLAAGILVRTNLDETTYLDAKGNLFTVATPDVAERLPLPASVMPTGLPDLLTDQELRDLLAYLTARR
jgi:putative membrane-bound dehydrogenase-like protein